MSLESLSKPSNEISNLSLDDGNSRAGGETSYDPDDRIEPLISSQEDTEACDDFDPDKPINVEANEIEDHDEAEYDEDNHIDVNGIENERAEIEDSENEHGEYDKADAFQDRKKSADSLLSSESSNDDEASEDDSFEKKGGSYKEVRKEGEGDKVEVHHMPADSASSLDRNDGPAIKMEKADHRMTASCGSSREARAYQAEQKELIDQGRFRDAVQMDIDDIREKFGNKYDDAIAEMLTYVNKLEVEGKING